MEKVYEPVFGCDVEFESDRSKWCVDDFFAAQPFESFGVKTSEEGNALKEGKIIENLLVTGDILRGGQNNVEEVCKTIM